MAWNSALYVISLKRKIQLRERIYVSVKFLLTDAYTVQILDANLHVEDYRHRER